MRKSFPILLLLLFFSSNIFAQYSWVSKIAATNGLGNPIVVDNTNKNLIIYGAGNRLYKSTDRGETFVTFGNPLPGATSVKNVIIHPRKKDDIFVAINASGGYRTLVSSNGGDSWETTMQGLNFSFYGIPTTQDPSHPDTIYMMSGSAFMRSADFGKTWSTLTTSTGSNGAPCDIEVFADTSVILIGDLQTGIFRSTNYGQTWALVYSTSGEIPTIAMDESKNGVAWATKFSGGGGVIKTTDFGATWVIKGLTPTSTWGVSIHPDNSDYVAVGTWSGSNVYITKNDGATWTTTTLPASNYAVKVIDTMNVFSAQSGGLFKLQSPWFSIPVELSSFTSSVNKNAVTLNWTTATETNNYGFEIEKSKDNENFTTLSFIPGFGTTTETKSYSYTSNESLSGIYYYRLKQIDYDGTSEYSNSIEVEVIIPGSYSLSQNFPNPFNPSTTIYFSLPVEAAVSIKLYNVMGEETATILSQAYPAGNFSLNLDASRFTSGVYFYRLEASGNDGSSFIDTKKLTLLK
jgi:photosystem II stability/assembly factor-like uncharacterized protein